MWNMGHGMDILPQPVLKILHCGIIHLLQQPLDISSIIQNDRTLFLHVPNIITAHISQLQDL